MLENIRIVLVNTSHPGNIGAAARAMKTMGLRHLTLIQPAMFPSGNATAMAAGADDVLAEATVVDSLKTAIADCELVLGTSARLRRLQWTLLTPDKAAARVKHAASTAKVAIVFGHEQSGLANHELQMCHYHINIPGNPEYNVLNLAQAVQIICYEVKKAYLEEKDIPEEFTPDEGYATAEATQQFYDHLHKTLLDIKFYPDGQPRQVMSRLRRLFQRARLDTMEVRILRGVLSQIQFINGRSKVGES